MTRDASTLNDLQPLRPALAFETLFEQFSDRIYRLALGLLRDSALAEDVVQDTFLSAMLHQSQFEGRSSVSTWLYRIAYNASMDRLRRKGEEPLPADEPDDEDNQPIPHSMVEWRLTPENIQSEAEIRRVLDEASAKLPRRLQEVFILRDMDELSVDETAAVLGITQANVKVRLHRARLALRETLAGYFGRNEVE